MNIVRLNTVSLDGIIKKGSGGGGVPINNQSKSVEFTENGTSEVRYDAGYTGLEKVSVKVAIPTEEKEIEITENGTTEVVADNGFLSKVVVNTNVQSGGGADSDIPVIGDGKTYLYIKIAEKGRMDVPLYFSQTVANGVTIDWGDGSEPQTLSGTGDVNTTHTYADVGEYAISLNPADGCTLGLGHKKTDVCVMGPSSTYDDNYGYAQMLVAVEWGHKASVTSEAFYNCRSLKTFIITASLSIIMFNPNVFYNCSSLADLRFASDVPVALTTRSLYGCTSLEKLEFSSLVLGGTCTEALMNSGVKKIIVHGTAQIGDNCFKSMKSLVSIEVLGNVSYIGNNAFNGNFFAALYNFSHCTSVPALQSTSVFSYIPSDCKIVVPDALYDEWIAATNWASYASNIIRASEFNA